MLPSQPSTPSFIIGLPCVELMPHTVLAPMGSGLQVVSPIRGWGLLLGIGDYHVLLVSQSTDRHGNNKNRSQIYRRAHHSHFQVKVLEAFRKVTPHDPVRASR